MNLDPAWIALIGTVFGGVGLKVLDHYLGKNKLRSDDATRMRDELRIEINNQKDEINKLEAQRDEWQLKYLDVRDQLSKLQTELTLALAKIEDQTKNARNKLDESQ